MDNQVKKLKLNVTNIKSNLISSNKKLKKLQIKKNNLLTGLQKRKDIRAKESRIEKKIGAGFKNIASAVTAPVKGIFDKVLEFAGLILAGIAVNFLPEIITGIETFFNSAFMKGVKSVIGGFVNIIASLGNMLGGPFSSKEKNEQLEKDIKKLGKDMDADLNDASVEKDMNAIEKLFAGFGAVVKESKDEETSSVKDTPNLNSVEDLPTLNQFSGGGTVKSSKQAGTKQQGQSIPTQTGTKPQRLANNGFIDFKISVDRMKENIESDKSMFKTFTDIIIDKKVIVSDDVSLDNQQTPRSINWEGIEGSKTNISAVDKTRVSSLLASNIESDPDRDVVVLFAIKPVAEPMPIITPVTVSKGNTSVASPKASALWGRR